MPCQGRSAGITLFARPAFSSWTKFVIHTKNTRVSHSEEDGYKQKEDVGKCRVEILFVHNNADSFSL